jgi:hypothetical protein
MPGDLAAAIDIDDWRPVEGSLEVLGATTCGVDRLMLEQQHGVRQQAADYISVDFFLKIPAGLVLDRCVAEADLADVE